MKAHVWTDKRVIVPSLATTDVKAADITQLPKHLRGQQPEVFGDQTYWCEFHRRCAQVAGIRSLINRRGTRSRSLTAHQQSSTVYAPSGVLAVRGCRAGVDSEFTPSETDNG
jgi:IS5 family transposase